MNVSLQEKPSILGLFEKRVAGDDCLLELAQRRFLGTGMGTEMYAETPEQLEWLLSFRPSPEVCAVAHLGRNLNLVEDLTRKRILEFAARFAGRVAGLVLHDHPALADRPNDYVEAAWALEDALLAINGSPMLYVEYAAGLEFERFADFFASIRDLERVSACVDIGHAGLKQVRSLYARDHGGEDICSLKSRRGRPPEAMPEIERVLAGALPAVLDLVSAIGALKKRVHFHLHDAHPLSTCSPFGISDHLSFCAEIPLGFEYRGSATTGPMFGPAGLEKIVARAIESAGARNVSFTLEIHPTGERLPLNEDGQLFSHWAEKANAEKTNHWLSLLVQNHNLLREAIEKAIPLPAGPPLPQTAAALEPAAGQEETDSVTIALRPAAPTAEETPTVSEEERVEPPASDTGSPPPIEEADSP